MKVLTGTVYVPTDEGCWELTVTRSAPEHAGEYNAFWSDLMMATYAKVMDCGPIGKTPFGVYIETESVPDRMATFLRARKDLHALQGCGLVKEWTFASKPFPQEVLEVYDAE